MKKILSFFRKYSYIIIPMFIFIIMNIIEPIRLKLYTINQDATKIPVIISMDSVFIGLLLAIFTVYCSFPRNTELITRIRNSGHEKIFKNSIIFGCIFFTLSIMVWLFDIDINILTISHFFLMGISDICISIYYIYRITNYL